jgi:hypothetical protein
LVDQLYFMIDRSGFSGEVRDGVQGDVFDHAAVGAGTAQGHDADHRPGQRVGCGLQAKPAADLAALGRCRQLPQEEIADLLQAPIGQGAGRRRMDLPLGQRVDDQAAKRAWRRNSSSLSLNTP